MQEGNALRGMFQLRLLAGEWLKAKIQVGTLKWERGETTHL